MMVAANEFVVLWRLRGHGRDVRCLRQKTRSGLELRVLWGDQLFLTEPFADESRLLDRAEEFRTTLEARGWQAPSSGSAAAAAPGGQAPESAPVSLRSTSYPVDAGDGERRPTVLLVDDEADVRTFLRGYLEASGYAVCEAADVDGALNALDVAPVDAVVLDVRMPDPRGWGRTGLEVLSFIRLHAAFAALPVMVLTGHQLEGEELALVQTHRAELFAKSQGYQVLLHHLDRVTGRTRWAES